jgi:DegV family protein with EDD domain
MTTQQRKIASITDGGCDLTTDEALARGYDLVPVPLAFPDGSTSDSNAFPVRDFWEELLSNYESLPKTSKPNQFAFDQKLEAAKEAGYEAALIITMSTGLSATFESALSAAENSPILTRVVDSRSITGSQASLCDQAVKGAEAGLSLDHLVEYVQAVRESFAFFFVVDTLEYLVRGGRAGRAAGLLAAALDIKPILTIEDDGVINSIKKARGRKKAFRAVPGLIHDKIEGYTDAPDLSYIMLKSDQDAVAEELHATIEKTQLPGTFKGTSQIGLIVGIYCGPGTAGVLYWRDLDPMDFAPAT